MKRGKRFGLSAEQKSDVWRRWKAGQTLHEIGRLRGSGNSHIATLVERHSRFVMLIKVASRDTAEVVGALSKHVRKLPATLRRSLTWDRGLEMAKHKDFTVATEVKVYFCDPQSPWQRGSNENRPDRLFPVGSEQSGAALKSTPPRDFRFSDSCE